MPEIVWRKSSFSSGPQGECVEVASEPDGLIRIRESDQPDEILATAPPQWDAFLKTIKAGGFGPTS